MTMTQDYSGVPVLLQSRSPAPGGALDLWTGVAGPIAQACVNSGVGRAVLGDPSAAAARSASLCDGMREDNRGRHVWLPMDPSELSERLASRGVG
jgi:Domain of unknown function (DUF4180)